MADVTLTYKGATIAELNDSGSKTIRTAGKFCEADIALAYVKPSGSGDGWQRPAEWPDYSRLHLVEDGIEAWFTTVDNRNPPTTIELTASSAVSADIVTIGADGSVTVIEHNDITGTFTRTFTADDAPYPCVRLTPSGGNHLNNLSLNGAGYSFQNMKILERYVNAPNCTRFGNWTARSDWYDRHVVSDTILSCAPSLTYLGIKGSIALQNLQMPNGLTIAEGSLQDLQCLKYADWIKTAMFTKASLQSWFANVKIAGSINLSAVAVPNCTNLSSMLQSNPFLRYFISPKSMGSVGSLGSINRYCYSLEGADFDGSFVGSTGQYAWQQCYNMKALVLRAGTVVALTNTNAVSDWLNAAGGRVYVPAAVLNEYKAATNWSTYAAYILPIEGSIYETQYVDGTPIPTT